MSKQTHDKRPKADDIRPTAIEDVRPWAISDKHTLQEGIGAAITSHEGYGLV